ncbi:TonB-dependent Receptor Plug Domain [Lysobacter sp. yr284]|uniref:TonB-dependent receptor n=1 Tax=Lysobacter TaxID=68 RepID=UPI00089446C8|nr:TonB-dependent receptor [Lysobacter sp. yr284]SDZ23339.1 TonB-dependent Receptor Plug Domain [Lysobacter sp. yr284]
MAKISHAFIVSVALTFSPVAGALPAAQGDIPADGYTISPGALDDALNAFATRNRLQLIYSPALVARRRTAGLRGRPPMREGLAQLLEGTGLTAVAVKANVYLLQPAPRPRPRPQPAIQTGTPPAPAPRGPTTTELDTVHVTGSRIGRAAFESSLPLTLITNEQIRSSGHQTLFDVLRLLPGMSGHHPRNVATENGASQVPSAAAASASLYSLGPRATLFLVDGRRMANYGLVSTDYGALTDLNGIPLSMVDHIEIAHGGASAIYGADAMAGVVNIILKKDYRGAEVGTSYGVSERGDAEQQRQYASFGEQTPGGGSVFVSVDHFTRNPLIGSQRKWATMDQRLSGQADRRYRAGYFDEYYRFTPIEGCEKPTEPGVVDVQARCSLDLARYVSLQPGITSNALYTYFRQPFGTDKEFYADLRATRVGLEVQNPPFNAALGLPTAHPDSAGDQYLNYWFSDVGPIRSRSVTTTRDFTVGVKGLRDKWEWDVSLAQRRNKVANRITGLINMPAVTQEVQTMSLRFDKAATNEPKVLAEIAPQTTMGGEIVLDMFSASVEGPLFELPAGEARLAGGVEARREVLRARPDDDFVQGHVALAQEFDARRASRNTSALYGEVDVPLLQKLWLNAAWRLDRSSGYGSQISPMYGLRWQPLQSLVLRASMGEGYRAPTLAELRRPLTIGNKQALIEAADSPAPCAVPLFDEDGNEIGLCQVEVFGGINAKLRPETSTSRNFGVVWTPSEELAISLDRYRIHRRNEIVATASVEYPNLFPQQGVLDGFGQLSGITRQLDNYGSTDVRGWELSVEYRVPTQRWGNLAFRLNGHYLDTLRRGVHPQVAELDYSGFGTPNRTVLGSVRWAYRDWNATLNLRYMGPATVYKSAPDVACPRSTRYRTICSTPSATLLGLDLTYGGFDKWLLGVNISNLNDRRPVNYDYNAGGYSLVDDDPVGRYYLVSAMYRF